MGSLSTDGDGLPPLRYPPARRDDSVVDDYFGVRVPDPYRWLEDPDSEEVRQFVEKQVALTDSVLAKCGERERLRRQITTLFDHPRYDTPFKRGGKYFFFHNTGLQAQSVLYVQNDLDAEAEVLLDPNGLSEDGTVALSISSVSKDGKYLAYGLSASGSDWVTIKVMRVDDKKPEPDTISWVKFSSVSWTNDANGFFYSRYPAPKEDGELDAGTETNINLNHQLYYHFLGLKGSTEMLPFIKLVDDFEARYEAVANDDSEFTFLTNKGAPRNKLVRVDLREPNSWTDILPEDQKDVLESAYAVNDNQLLVSYLSDVKYVLQIRDLKTGTLLHHLPIDIGTVFGISGRREDSEVFIGFTSFLTPGIIYKCNLATEVPEMKIFREISVPGFDRTVFEVKQVFVSSMDGTKIPMFIVSKKNIELDGSHPALLYGYGGFNISLTPSFSVSRIILSRNLGFVFCIANIRGGGEYGEEWHKAGSLSKKQNCFDDFIACAEFLISTGYTNSKRLCIEGGSNGGLLVAACINQRPDLFGCALAHVGVMDMLRFHKFTIGHAWTTDYGSSDKGEEFHWLIKYSPLHNVKRPWEKSANQACQYPSTMLLTADHDDRVVPLHSLKLLATMQYALCTSVENSPQTNPIIARIECKAGHGAGRPTKKMIDEAADRYSFVAKVMGLTWMD
ncbi:prolyl endopeptidase [Cocos nucifera]|uniref:Prolyl endopeptidase n=1 Tax=Cocos nucifera TaxID=13894 RepID=A0A8K0IGW0_COCNU|nr:prolyl endopeptidase [Cocos nucifera]